jgi:hypothetical protein
VSRYEVKMLLRNHGVYRTVEKIYMPFQDPNNEREVSSMEVSSLGGSNTLLPTGGGGAAGRFPSHGGFGDTYPQYPSRRPSPYYDGSGEPDGLHADNEGNVAMRNKGFVFVTYSRASEADEALTRLNGAIHFNRRLVCRPGLPKGVSFRVGGGGGGGGGSSNNFSQQQLQPWIDGSNSRGGSKYGGSNSRGGSKYGGSNNNGYDEEKYNDSYYHGGGGAGYYGAMSSSGMSSYGGSGNDTGSGTGVYGRNERDEYPRDGGGGSNGYYYGGGSGYDTGYGKGHWQQQSSRGMGSSAGRAGWGAQQQTHPEAHDQYAVPSGGGGGNGGPLIHGYTSYKFKALGVKPGASTDAEGDAAKNNNTNYSGSGGQLAGVRPRSAFEPGYAADPDDRLQGYIPVE